MKRKELFLASLFSLSILGTCSYFLFQGNTNKEEVASVMKENKSVLALIKDTSEFKEEYQTFYGQIIYFDFPSFFHEINILLSLGYMPEEINSFYTYMKHENIEKLLDYEKLDLKEYYAIPNFEVDKIPRYEVFKDEFGSSLSEAVLKVNIGLDHDFYTNVKEIEEKEELTVLVNKYRTLGMYEPEDLESLSYDEHYKLRKVARDAFEELVSGAKLDGVYLRPYSAYRSYTYQESIYNTYVLRDGKEVADTYSARPGHSEHQTGLAVDVKSEGCNEITTSEAKWLEEHAHEYGFIVRYTKENESITGYIEEPWHLRYLGTELAKKVVDSNLTYDEYYDLYLK